jgi:hypothetical protein
MVTFILVLIGPPIYTLPKMLSCSFGPSMCIALLQRQYFLLSIAVPRFYRDLQSAWSSSPSPLNASSGFPYQYSSSPAGPSPSARLYTLLDRRRMRSMRLMRCMHITAIPITLPRSPILYRLQLLPRSHPPLCVLRPFFVLLFPLLVPSCLLLPSSFGVLLDQCIVWPKFRILLPDAASFEVVE